MKKLILILLIFLVLPTYLLAQGTINPLADTVIQNDGIKPPSCCILKHRIKSGDSSKPDYEVDDIVGPPNVSISYVDKVSYDGSQAFCSHVGEYYPTTEWGGVCAVNTVMNVVNWIMWIAGIFTVLIIMIAGISYMTSGGSPEQVKKSIALLKYALIGIGIAIGSRIIPALFKYFVGI